MKTPPLEMLQRICSVAQEAARSVGVRIRSEIAKPSSFRIMQKASDEIVTEVDLWSEKQLIEAILGSFPNHLIIGEESAEELIASRNLSLEQLAAEGFSWVIDPIDGTTNFAKGIPQVSISIGVLFAGRRVVGVVYDPVRDELFSAIVGQGATLNGEKISVSSQALLAKSVVATGFPYDHVAKWGRYKPAYEAIFLAVRDIRRFGSAALDQCWVACGRFDAFFEYSLRSWDVCAGALIVEEAGGKIGHLSQPVGSEFSVFSDSFLFSNSPLFSDLHRLGFSAHKTAN
jgi:myo-inositol-1(or 4)-monophosphatase